MSQIDQLKKYSKDALLSMLEAELSRLEQEKAATLGSKSAKDFAKDASDFVWKLILKHPALTAEIFETYVIDSIIQFLVEHDVIAQVQASRDDFVVSLIAALILDELFSKWNKRKKKK